MSREIDSKHIVFAPQPGPQTQFMACSADIALYGGAAGGGKTYAILLEAGRWVKCDEYHATIFRRKSTDLHKAGALIDESQKIYPYFNGRFTSKYNKWIFKKNVDITFAGLQYENDKYNYQGSQNDFVGFDELTHFSKTQFWYIVGRLRSTSGNVKPYFRGTCNPEPGWVLELIDWWIDERGFPIPERAGVIRWLIKLDDEYRWFDTEVEAADYLKTLGLPPNKQFPPTSLTFIPAKLDDNQILLEKNPEYVRALYAQEGVERQRLLFGNWRVTPEGNIFKQKDFKTFVKNPDVCDLKCIIVDTAQETKTANDFTVIAVYERVGRKLYLTSLYRGHWTFYEQKQRLANTIREERPDYILVERKANGSALMQEIDREFVDDPTVEVCAIERNKDKYTRAVDAQYYVQRGHVYVNPNAPYFVDFMNEAKSFCAEKIGKVHDDQLDTMFDGIEYMLANPIKDIVEDKPPINPNPFANHSVGVPKHGPSNIASQFTG